MESDDPGEPVDDAEAAQDVDGDEASTPRPVDRFHKSAVGSVVAASLFGLRDALEGRPEREEITIVSEAPTSPVDDITLVFDDDDPTALKVVVARPPDEPADDQADDQADP